MILIDPKRLERLRREQDPRRYRETELPVLQIPLQENPRDNPPPGETPESPRVIIIEM